MVFSFSLKLILKSPTMHRLGLAKEKEMETKMKLGARETLREKRREVGAHTVFFFLSKKMSQLFNCQSNAFKHVTQILSFKRVIHVIKVWSSLNVLVEQYNFSQMWQVLK